MVKVIIPDGEIKESKTILDDIVICSDGSQYYWNVYSKQDNTIYATLKVNSIPEYTVDEKKLGIVNKLSFILSNVDYYATGNNIVYPYGGSGSGCKVQLDTTSYKKYSIESISIVDAGVDYITGDAVFSDTLGSYTVTSTNTILKNQISNVDITFSTSYSETSFPQYIDCAGDSNSTPSTFEILSSEADRYEIDTITIVNSGSNYNTGDVITINGIGSFSLNVDYGTKNITSINVVSLPSETYISLPSYKDNLPSYNQTGSGSGATFKATYTTKYCPNKCALQNVGNGYSIGDILTILDDGTNTIKATVTDINVNDNKIITFAQDPAVVTVPEQIQNYIVHADGGTGKGASFIVNSSASDVYVLSNVIVNSYGFNYAVGDEISLPNNVVVTVSSIYDDGTILKYNKTLSSDIFYSIPKITNVATSNGTGTGALCSLSFNSTKYYIASSIKVLSGGINFVQGDKVTTDYGDITILSTYSGGEILSYNTTLNNYYYYGSSSSNIISGTGGTGTGATFQIIVENGSNGTMYYPTISMTYAGDYASVKPVPILIYSNGTQIGTITINSLNSNNQISDYTVTITQVASLQDCTFVRSDHNPLKPADAKWSATFTTTRNYYTVTSIAISNIGSNYTIGDSIAVTGGTVTVQDIGKSGQISGYSFTSNNVKNYTTTSQISISSDTGTGASFSVYFTSNSSYKISDFNLTSFGSGYVVGDILTVGNNYGTIEVTSISTKGMINSISFTYDESYSLTDLSESNVSGTGGAGTGATFDTVFSSSKLNVISGISLNDAGYGYTSGDSLTIGEYGTVTVKTTDTGPQSIKNCSYSITNNYENANVSGTYTASGGTGSGASFNVSTSSAYFVDSISLNNGGTNYNVNDTLLIDGAYYDDSYYSDGGIATVTGIAKNSQPVSSLYDIKSNIIETPVYGTIQCQGGSGTGLEVEISYKNIAAYKITSIVLHSSGTGYKIGEQINLNGYGTATVTETADGGGNVLALSQNIKSNASSKQTDFAGNYILTGGSGNGLTINVKTSMIEYYRISNIELLDGGYGYNINDTLQIDSFQQISVMEIKNIL